MSSHTLSLRSASLIIINIILGTGVFINTALLMQRTGFLGGLLYPVAGFFFLPVVLGMARLVSFYERGNFYTFGATISSFWAIFTSLSYFVTKLASSTLSITVFSRFLLYSVPALQNVPMIAVATSVIVLFTALNLLNVRLGSLIQMGFIVMKMAPLFTIIMLGLYHYKILVAVNPVMLWSGCAGTLPLLFFCFLGFEAACSLTPIIENPQKNAPRAILIAFFTVLFISFLFQTILYCGVGSSVTDGMLYTSVFPLFFQKMAPAIANFITPVLSLFIGCSALGGAYGILYSNMWNLHTVSMHHIFPGSSYIMRKSRFGIPTYAVLCEGFLCLVYLFVTRGAQLPLQLTSVFGSVIVYTICMFVLCKREPSALSYTGLLFALLLVGATCYRFIWL